MTTVYLPIEISRREAVAKSFLAAQLAKRGHQVLVFRSDVFDRVGWPGPGIYIGKNVFRSAPPHDLSFYRQMKLSDIRVWHLDEEGGVYLGASEDDWRAFLVRRVDPAALGPDDKVLTWGDWQREFFTERKLSAPVLTTGHVNFDVCRPEYHDALADFDARETGGATDYILINTRFVTSNARDNGASHFINTPIVRAFFDEPALFSKLVADGKTYFDFVGLIRDIAVRFPDRKIVLRPHPAENSESYARIFAKLPNVTVTETGDVGSWIRRAACVIHNGCTTAIQAVIAGKPVITYMPSPDDPKAMACLPNKVGTIAITVDDVLRAIEKAGEFQDMGAWRRTISRLDSVDCIADLVDQEGDMNGREVPISTARRATAVFTASELVRAGARLILPGRRQTVRKSMELFGEDFFGRIGEIGRSAARHYGGEIKINRLSRYCFTFLPGNGVSGPPAR